MSKRNNNDNFHPSGLNSEPLSTANQQNIQRLKEQLDKTRENLMSRQKSQNNYMSTQQPKTNTSLYGTLGGNKCTHSDCPRPIYKQKYFIVSYIYKQLCRMCKQHYCLQVKAVLKKELRNIFRGPDKAYASMDFYGRGYITEEDFLNSIVISRIPFAKEDVQEFFKQFNIFSSKGAARSATPMSDLNSRSVDRAGGGSSSQTKTLGNYMQDGGMNFDQFKKMFFPQLFLINEEHDSEEDRKLKQKQFDLSGKKRDKNDRSPQKQPESIITDRLKKLEKILKDKFQNQWESVRKAFLALDSDYDGYITVEDILRYFGQEKDLDYNDLKKLIKDKDSKKIGKIGYTDFSKWVGNSIHQSEGFYFRHDSVKNPQFEMNNERNEMNQNNKSKIRAQESLINQNLEKTVLDKIQFQWKTLRKAFMDLNMEKSGSIMPEELRFYFKHWGLTLTDEQFKYLFEKFDLDGDGKISYKDFQLTVGSEIHPAEGLYFRQDKPQQSKINSCKHEKCWQPTQGIQNYCSLHLKLHQDECTNLFGKIFSQIKTKWPQFIEEIKKSADQDDKNQIFLDQLQAVLRRFKCELQPREVQILQDSFHGRDEGQRVRVNVARLYDHKFSMMLDKIYKNVDVHENDGDDDPVDQSGYTGQFYRQKRKLIPITEQELVQIFARNSKLVEIIRTIKEIDKQHNGFVTTTELDDILKIQYKEELGDRDLKQIMKKYASIQNRVLVDYKKFRDGMVSQIKLLNTNFTYPITEASTVTPDKNTIPLNKTFNKNNDEIMNLSLNKNKELIVNSINNRQKSVDKLNHSRYESHNHSKINTNTYQSQDNLVKESQNNTLDENRIIQIKELIRPQTRQIIKYSGTQNGINLKKQQYLKNNILNQTMYNSTLPKNKQLSLLSSKNEIKLEDINGGKSFLAQSKTPNQGPQRLRLKQRSSVDSHNQTYDGGRLIDDYNNIVIGKQKGDDSLIDTQLLDDNLKRAQSSHGVFGRNNQLMTVQRLKTMNAANQGNKYPGINNLLQNLRDQRRNIQTAIDRGDGSYLNNNEKQNDSILYQSKQLNQTINIKNNSQAQIDYIDQSFDHNYNSTHNIGVEVTRNPKLRSFINRKQSEGLNSSYNQNNGNINMYQTMNNSSFSTTQSSKNKSILKQKLSYEWKNIYRQLSMNDKQSNGIASLSDFESALDQFHVFMSKEEFRKVQNLYGGPSQNLINYQQLSVDLGLHNNQLNFLKNSSVRMQNIQKLRNIYSRSNEKKMRINSVMDRLNSAQIGDEVINRPLNTASSANNNFLSGIALGEASTTKEMSRSEVQQVLLTRIKDFRDLISTYQKRNSSDQAIIPMGEFQNILRGIGISINKENLRRFAIQTNTLDEDYKKIDRSKSVGSTRNIQVGGIDAKEFMKFYI